jgi:hypothetical protein
MFDSLQDVQRLGVSLLSIGWKEAWLRKHQHRFGEGCVPAKRSNQPGEIIDVPLCGVGVYYWLAFEGPHEGKSLAQNLMQNLKGRQQNPRARRPAIDWLFLHRSSIASL